MGRIIASVAIVNLLDTSKRLRFDALVDTGASHLVLPKIWRERFGALPVARFERVKFGALSVANVEICGPVKIQIEGFRPICGEVVFFDMPSETGSVEPLLGSLPLVASQAGVDATGNRLSRVNYLDLK